MTGKRGGKKVARVKALPSVGSGINLSPGMTTLGATETTSPPLGSALLQTMSAEVSDWNNQISTRYAHLAEYVDSLEKLNDKLEIRVDRSLAMAQGRV